MVIIKVVSKDSIRCTVVKIVFFHRQGCLKDKIFPAVPVFLALHHIANRAFPFFKVLCQFFSTVRKMNFMEQDLLSIDHCYFQSVPLCIIFTEVIPIWGNSTTGEVYDTVSCKVTLLVPCP